MDNLNGLLSLLIACIEFLLLFNLLLFVRKDKKNVIAIIMITLLAAYQTMEFLMCQVKLQNPFYPFLAFVLISFLPPLNLLLALNMGKAEVSKRFFLVFLPATAFSFYYLFVIPQFAVTQCTVLYASYHYPLGDLFGFFYYLPIFISTVILIRTIRTSKNSRDKIIAKILLSGTIFISIPVLIGFTLMLFKNYSVISAVESIMCKFAFVYSICLSFICLYNSNISDERNYFKYLFSNKQ